MQLGLVSFLGSSVVEHSTSKLCVMGSNPARAALFSKDCSGLLPMLYFFKA